MRGSILGVVVLALVVTGGYAVLAGNRCGKIGAASAKANAGSACSPAPAAASSDAPMGKLTGRFDPTMAGCRFACATKIQHDAGDLVAQPGVKLGQLTQCPVSGVVFAVDENRPHVRHAGDEYVTCCDRCATKLRQNPRRFVKA